MNEKTITITSLGDYILNVSLQPSASFYSRTTNYKPIYRGQANLQWKIEPAVYRNGRFYNESSLIREMERVDPASFASLSRIERIIKMQHYGLPTRLLDFTYNSLVALYFACCSQPLSDGVVYELRAFPLYNQDFVWISIITKYIYEYGRLPFNVTNMISELKRDLLQYPTKGVESFYEEEAIIKILTTPIGLFPRFTNNRIRCQDGVFVITGMEIKERHYDGIIFDKRSYTGIDQLWPESRSIVVPANNKEAILEDLAKIGIHKGKLFPELDTQAQYITNYFDGLK